MGRSKALRAGGVVGGLLKGALPALTVATLVPLGLFYASLALWSQAGAMVVSVVYAYGACAYQLRSRRRVSGMLIVTVLMATVKGITYLLSGRPFLYFAIPALETIAFGLAFLFTMNRADPLALRLARDLVPGYAGNLAHRRDLVRRLSLVWATTYIASGLTTSALLISVPLPVFVGAHTLTGWCWSGLASVASFLLCRGCLSGPRAADPALRLDPPVVCAPSRVGRRGFVPLAA